MSFKNFIIQEETVVQKGTDYSYCIFHHHNVENYFQAISLDNFELI